MMLLPARRLPEVLGLLDKAIEREPDTLWIAPEYQRRGLGTAAMNEILADARKRKLGVVLSVLKANVGARLLYQRFGFVIIEETAHHHRMRLDFS